MKRLAAHSNPLLRRWKDLWSRPIPLDGPWRYVHDIGQPFALLLLTVAFTAGFYVNYSPSVSIAPNDFFFCNADGNVEKQALHYSPLWDPQLYFTVNIAFGRFAFSSAKVIDAIWDVVAGRGGQMLAAAIAYRVLRRSLTLTMERQSLTMPTVTSLYCQQIQIIPVIRLAYNSSWHRNSHQSNQRQASHLGRLRLANQVFICVYVLSFATLVSVMTGYRALLTGYFGYNAHQPSQLLPTSELVIPRLAVFDATKIGLPDELFVANDEIIFPSQSSETRIYEAVFRAGSLLASSRHFEEPYGTLVDYYLTCLAVRMMRPYDVTSPTKPNNVSYDVDCAFHDCSCSIPAGAEAAPCHEKPYFVSTPCTRKAISDIMTSTVVLNGTSWELSPPLDIEMPRLHLGKPGHPQDGHRGLQNASDFWSGYELVVSRSDLLVGSDFRAYIHNGTGLNETTIRETGRCVAEDAYSWGFSSLLLFTFCLYTIVFAIALIILQTDVYWNSRHDRAHQSHSIYTDVLYLADELKAIFGTTIEGNASSPKRVEKMVEHAKEGLNLDVSELPPSRWQQRQLSRRKKSTILPTRGDSSTTPLSSTKPGADSSANELRALSSEGSTQLEPSDLDDGELDLERRSSPGRGVAHPRSSHD